MKLFKRLPRPRFDVEQVQNGEVVKVHATAVGEREAKATAYEVNRMLLFCRLMAPSGPRDAHARVVPTREVSA